MINMPQTYGFRIDCIMSFISREYSWDYRHEQLNMGVENMLDASPCQTS